MKLVRYACTHCGRRFEAEEKEIQECPGCFWSTSVKREEEVASEPVLAGGPASPKNAALAPLIRQILLAIVAVALVGGLLFSLIPTVRKIVEKRREQKAAEPQKPAAPKAEKPKKGDQKSAQVPAGAAMGAPAAEDQAILDRRIQVSADRAPVAEEEKILNNRAPFRTGLVEKLPSQPWNLENFKQMVAEQERFYKVPFPGSYKRKLEKLFKEKYQPAAEAFTAGDLLKARDLWVESLALPIYSTDVQRQRGVALTLLKPFITDTLSKIGAINSTLVESSIRDKEKAVTDSYAKVSGLITKKDWKAALDEIQKLQKQLDEFARPGQLAAAPPPYPAGIRGVDTDIQATLQQVMSAPPPSVADLGPIQYDVEAKRKVVESFLPDRVEAAQAAYDEALDLIKQKKWADAEAKLREIKFPPPLAQDAQEKLSVLKKLTENKQV